MCSEVIRGGPRPWKRRDGIQVIHAAMKPPSPTDVDFSALGLTFPVIKDTTNMTKHGWSEPPSAMPALPFFVERTQVGSSIPVYTEFKAGRTKIVTILRRCGGDVASLRDEMQKVCGTEVIVRPGKLIVNGNYSMRLKKWLIGLGF
jgi:large subunit ribosomal protein L49